MALVGNRPRDLGLVDLNPTEMMFWLYCPISEAGDLLMWVPDNLWQFKPILDEVYYDDIERWQNSYVYLTAKTLWVEGNYVGNRPGWHCDGFGTSDLNYIWADRAPTDFLYTGGLFPVSDDCDQSMRDMEEAYQRHETSPVERYPDKHLLRLDKTVVHRSPVWVEPGMRTFVKVSLSKDRYDLIGNSINHRLRELSPRVPRKATRNHPASAQ